MASVTKTFTENEYSSYKATWTVNLTGYDLNVTATGQNVRITNPTLTAKYVHSSKSYGQIFLQSKIYARSILMGATVKSKEA